MRNDDDPRSLPLPRTEAAEAQRRPIVSLPRPPVDGRSHQVVTSEQIFAGATEVQIHHHGAVYRLKQTALGKLILTK
jgi:hemin uptake protein HemP